MFEQDKVFYSNDDYTVRMEKADGCEKYYIKFHSQTHSPEQEISLDVFMLYYREFNKPLENQRNERRRHIEDGDIDSFAISQNLEENSVLYADLEAALKTCTPVQQKRFKLYFLDGYSFVEIAKMEGRDAAVVRRSVLLAVEKIKKYF